MATILNRERLRTPFQKNYVLASEEDRCAPRYELLIPARLRFSGSQSFAVQVTDMSLAGFSCDALLQSPSGTLCWLMLPGLSALEAEIVHQRVSGIGCAFKNLLGPAVLDQFIARYPAPAKDDY